MFSKKSTFLSIFFIFPLSCSQKFMYIKNVNRFLDIYQFTHFRKFLEEYQAVRVKAEPGFTRTEICNLLGLEKSRSYFADVLRGKKVSPRMVQKFIEILELDKKEAKYFETLVEFDQAKSDSARQTAMQEILKQHPNPQHIVNEDAYEYYSHWYNSALFAILDAMDITDDMTPVQKRIFPKIPLGKLKESLALLERLGLARKNESGLWKPTQESISSGPYNNAELIKRECSTVEYSNAKNALAATIESLNQNASYALYTVEREVIPLITDKPSARYYFDMLSLFFQELAKVKAGDAINLTSYANILDELAVKLPHIEESLLEIMTLKSDIELNVNMALLLSHLVNTITKE